MSTLASVSAGVCTTTGEACGTDQECGGAAGSCFLPPGGCIENLETACTIHANGTSSGCSGTEFCAPRLGFPGAGHCHENHGPCASDADCTAPASCRDERDDFIRLFAPFAGEEGGEQLFGALEDFVHGMNIPDLKKRLDLVPGRVTRLELQPKTAGVIEFLCDNFCGEGHETMHGRFVVTA